KLYECYIIKEKKCHCTSEWRLENHLTDEDEEDDESETPLIMCHRTAGTPKEAIKRAIEEMNIWKQCQGCSMYVRNLNDNQKCFQCLLSATIMDEIPKEQKFVC